MKYGDSVIWPEYDKGETDEKVLIALAMAAYELSEPPLDPDDPDELFPSKGCLLPHEAREFIREGKYGFELVMHIAFERLCMLEVQPERRCRDGVGSDGIFIINGQRYGRDVEALITHANGIMYDLLRNWDRILLMLSGDSSITRSRTRSSRFRLST